MRRETSPATPVHVLPWSALGVAVAISALGLLMALSFHANTGSEGEAIDRSPSSASSSMRQSTDPSGDDIVAGPKVTPKPAAVTQPRPEPSSNEVGVIDNGVEPVGPPVAASPQTEQSPPPTNVCPEGTVDWVLASVAFSEASESVFRNLGVGNRYDSTLTIVVTNSATRAIFSAGIGVTVDNPDDSRQSVFAHFPEFVLEAGETVTFSARGSSAIGISDTQILGDVWVPRPGFASFTWAGDTWSCPSSGGVIRYEG